MIDAGGLLTLHALPSGEAIQRWTGEKQPGAAAFDPDGGRLAVAATSATILYDSATGKEVWRLPTTVGMKNVCWGPAGDLLATVAADKRIYLWDVPARNLCAALEGGRNGGIEIAFNHAGDLLASCGWDNMLLLWDRRTGRQEFSTPAQMSTVRFSPDDRLLAAEQRDGKVRIWEAAAGRTYQTLAPAGGAAPRLYSGAADPGGRLVAAKTAKGVLLWDLGTGLPCASLPAASGHHLVAFAEDGSLLTTASGDPAGLARWPVRTDPADRDALCIGPPVIYPWPHSIQGLACSADGRVLAAACFDAGAVAFDRDRPHELIPLRPQKDVRYISVSPNGRWVAAGSHWGGGLRVWDLQGRRVVLEVPSEMPVSGVFSADGRWLAVNDTGYETRLWSVGSWDEGRRIKGCMDAFSPDGRVAVVRTMSGAVCLVDPETGKEYARLEDPNRDRGLAFFSADGAAVLTACDESAKVHVWDLRAIRRVLATRGLDWDLQPYPPAPPPRKPLRVTVAVNPADGPAPR